MRGTGSHVALDETKGKPRGALFPVAFVLGDAVAPANGLVSWPLLRPPTQISPLVHWSARASGFVAAAGWCSCTQENRNRDDKHHSCNPPEKTSGGVVNIRFVRVIIIVVRNSCDPELPPNDGPKHPGKRHHCVIGSLQATLLSLVDFARHLWGRRPVSGKWKDGQSSMMWCCCVTCA